MRDRIFHSDVRNLSQIPPEQYPQFPFERHEVWIAPPKPVVQTQPTGAPQTQAQSTYNAVADAFGSANMAAPAPAAVSTPAFAQPQQPAQPQQAQQPAFAQPQQHYSAPQQVRRRILNRVLAHSLLPQSAARSFVRKILSAVCVCIWPPRSVDRMCVWI